VRVRFSAFVLALLIAASPAIGLLCEMDCDHPPAASEPCHAAHGLQNDATLREAPHGCSHDHTGGNPALLSSAPSRYAAGPILVALSPALQIVAHQSRVSVDGGMHDPPGPTSRNTSSRLTVLRI
jgi:hypothetical protein